MDEVEIRRKILKILYNINKINHRYPVDSEDLKEKLDVTLEESLSNVKYLKGDGYVELQEVLGDEFEVKITQHGIKKVEKMD
jgi:Mn-dependent DtxR family transcriptional regulator